MKNYQVFVFVLTIVLLNACNRSGNEQESKSAELNLPDTEQVGPPPVIDYMALSKMMPPFGCLTTIGNTALYLNNELATWFSRFYLL